MKKVIVMLFVIMISVMACGCDMSNPLNIHEQTTITRTGVRNGQVQTVVEKYYDGILIYKD